MHVRRWLAAVFVAAESALVFTVVAGFGAPRLPVPQATTGWDTVAPRQPCDMQSMKPVTEAEWHRERTHIHTEAVSIDYADSVKTLRSALDQADAVVAGTITRQDYRNPDCAFLATLATMEVRAVLKSHPLLESSHWIVIERRGGAVRDRHVTFAQVEAEFPPFITGAQYILFLRVGRWGDRWPTTVWYPLAGPHTTLAVAEQTERLSSMSGYHGAVARVAEGLSLTEFMARVRQESSAADRSRY